jgi:hypothetical protein
VPAAAGKPKTIRGTPRSPEAVLLEQTLSIPRHLLVIRIALTPMPRPAADGSYPKFYKKKGKAAVQPKIHLEFERSGRTIDKRSWSSVISGENTFELMDGTTLNEDDLYMIDTQGWEILSSYGLFPTAMV